MLKTIPIIIYEESTECCFYNLPAILRKFYNCTANGQTRYRQTMGFVFEQKCIPTHELDTSRHIYHGQPGSGTGA